MRLEYSVHSQNPSVLCQENDGAALRQHCCVKSNGLRDLDLYASTIEIQDCGEEESDDTEIEIVRNGLTFEILLIFCCNNNTSYSVQAYSNK